MIFKNSLKILMVISIFFISSCFIISSVSAATVEVKSTDCGGINDGVNKANNWDTIVLSPGKYTGANNKGISLGKSVTFRGKGPANSVVIDAQKTDNFFSISGNVNVTFKNITFTKGNNKSPFSTQAGNFLINTGSTATFINCRFIDNSAYLGAVIYNKGNCIVINSSFSKNIAELDGGINNLEGGNLIVKDSNFTNNVIKVYGGAITNYMANCLVTNCIFSKNSGNYSGGIYNQEGFAIVRSNNFKNNKAFGIANTGNLTVSDNIFSGKTGLEIVSNGTIKDQSKPKLKTYLSLAKFQAKFKKKTTFKATLKNNLKKVMKSKTISFYANKKLLGKAITNKKGIATLTKKVTTRGKVSFKAKYKGSKTYKNSSFTRRVSVK